MVRIPHPLHNAVPMSGLDFAGQCTRLTSRASLLRGQCRAFATAHPATGPHEARGFCSGCAAPLWAAPSALRSVDRRASARWSPEHDVHRVERLAAPLQWMAHDPLHRGPATTGCRAERTARSARHPAQPRASRSTTSFWPCYDLCFSTLADRRETLRTTVDNIRVACRAVRYSHPTGWLPEPAGDLCALGLRPGPFGIALAARLHDRSLCPTNLGDYRATRTRPYT